MTYVVVKNPAESSQINGKVKQRSAVQKLEGFPALTAQKSKGRLSSDPRLKQSNPKDFRGFQRTTNARVVLRKSTQIDAILSGDQKKGIK